MILGARVKAIFLGSLLLALIWNSRVASVNSVMTFFGKISEKKVESWNEENVRSTSRLNYYLLHENAHSKMRWKTWRQNETPLYLLGQTSHTKVQKWQKIVKSEKIQNTIYFWLYDCLHHCFNLHVCPSLLCLVNICHTLLFILQVPHHTAATARMTLQSQYYWL